jgi:hypothetical protein
VLTAVVMKSSIFWDITPCSGLKVNRRFGRTYRLALLATCFHSGILNWFVLRPWRWRRYLPPDRRLTFNGPHAVISQKIIVLDSVMFRRTVLTSDSCYSEFVYRISRLLPSPFLGIVPHKLLSLASAVISSLVAFFHNAFNRVQSPFYPSSLWEPVEVFLCNFLLNSFNMSISFQFRCLLSLLKK